MFCDRLSPDAHDACPPTITMDLSGHPHATIDIIPPEILVLILYEVTHLPVELMRLALVCRTWRDIVLETGELWNRVTVRNRTREAQIRKQLNLSRQVPLTFDFKRYGVTRPLANLALGWNSPIPMAERVCSLEVNNETIRGKAGSIFGWQPLSEGHTWPRLKTLTLISSSRRFCVHLRAPNLETVKLGLIFFRDFSYIGLGSALRSVEWVTIGSLVDVAGFLAAIVLCPNLQRLKLVTNQAELRLPGSPSDVPLCSNPFQPAIAKPRRPEIPMDVPLWPKLVELELQCIRAGVADVLALLFHVPHLAMLHLELGLLAQSAQQAKPHFRPSPCLRQLLVKFIAESDERTQLQRLGSRLLHGVFDIYDSALLESIRIENAVVPRCGIPSFCSRLQEFYVKDVVLPHDFIEGLNQCPLLRQFAIYDSKIQGTSPSGDNEDSIVHNLTFKGSTFTGAFAQLETLTLRDIAVHPDFVAHLARYSCLKELDVNVLSFEADSSTTELDWPEIEAIDPLPKLSRLSFNFDPALPFESFDTSAVRYIISALAQLGSSMAFGAINLQPPPLRAADVSRLLCKPNRALFNVEIQFRSEDTSPETLGITFEAETAINQEKTERPRSLSLAAGITRIELAGVVQVIFDHFPLEGDIKLVSFDKEALGAAKMASERNPEATGLQYLLRRAQVVESATDTESEEYTTSDE